MDSAANVPALKRLLSSPAGTWHALSDWLGKRTAGETMVTWLAAPGGEQGYRMVIFHELSSAWLGSAHVNVEALNRGEPAN